MVTPIPFQMRMNAGRFPVKDMDCQVIVIGQDSLFM